MQELQRQRDAEELKRAQQQPEVPQKTSARAERQQPPPPSQARQRAPQQEEQFQETTFLMLMKQQLGELVQQIKSSRFRPTHTLQGYFGLQLNVPCESLGLAKQHVGAFLANKLNDFILFSQQQAALGSQYRHVLVQNLMNLAMNVFKQLNSLPEVQDFQMHLNQVFRIVQIEVVEYNNQDEIVKQFAQEMQKYFEKHKFALKNAEEVKAFIQAHLALEIKDLQNV